VPDELHLPHTLEYASKDELAFFYVAEKLGDACFSGIFTSEETKTKLRLMNRKMNALKSEPDYK
jgi:hypothetical protein